MQDLVK